MRLAEKISIVTGGGSGIGRATCERFAKEGSSVVVAEINEAAGQETVDLITDAGGISIFLPLDVTDINSVKAMVEHTVKRYGTIDILVNNAAAARGEDRVPITDLSDDVFKKVNDIKVFGTYLCTKAVVKVLKEQGEGGKIVNISSTAGKSGSANTLAYNAANFAVVGMTQSMARELGPFSINVNCVCPGFTETSRMDGLDLDQGADKTAIGRIGTDDEVGDFIAHLCTKATSWITGQSINVNGGSVVEH